LHSGFTCGIEETAQGVWIQEEAMGFRPMVILMLLAMGMLVSISDEGRAAAKPLSIEDIEKLLRSGVSPGRVAEIVEEQGVQFEITSAIRGRLRQAGANEQVLNAVERASMETTRRQLDRNGGKLRRPGAS
jgi:hypothetical protein